MKSSPKSYDVAVVGGGPSGATAAYLLAGKGYRVALIDKCTFPRPKLCAGLITWKTVDILNRIFGLSPSELIKRGVIIHASRDYRIYVRNQEIVRRRLDYPFHFVNRNIYDHFWVRTAQDAGAELIDSRKVVSLNIARRTLDLDDGMKLHANVIIGADGVWSKVRRTLFPEKQFKLRWQTNLAITIETSRPLAIGSPCRNVASLHFGYAPWGYAWCFPNPGRQIVGIGALGAKRGVSLAKAFRQFIAAATTAHEPLDDWQGHALPFGNYLDPPGIGRVLLVGDACGLADPLLGEGIFYAHRSGHLAAQAVEKTDRKGDDPASIYRQILNQHVLRELRWIKFYRNLLFYGGFRRRYRGLKLFFRLMPDRLEAAVHGKISFASLLQPWV